MDIPLPFRQDFKLRHPIVLCHGFGAIVTLLQKSHMHYVARYYQLLGLKVFVPHVTPYASIQQRTSEWKRKLLELDCLSSTGAVHLVGHSMGGLDIRRLAHDPDFSGRISSIHLVSVPNRGSSLSNLFQESPAVIRKPISWTANRVALRISKDFVPNCEESIRELRPDNVVGVFNPGFPDLETLPYYSYTASCGMGTGQTIVIPLRFFNRYIFDREGENDGFVSSRSAKWGNHVFHTDLGHHEQLSFGLRKDRWHSFYELWHHVLRHAAEAES